MSDSRCISCGRRKGRRACPALAGAICPTCCGTKRLSEIACPPDCAYLATARHHPPAVVQRRQEREARFLVPLIHDLSEQQHRLFLFLQSVIAGARPSALPPLTDRDVADAAGALAATIETERRGIIYEHHAASLPAQRLEQDLTAAVETHRKNGPASLDRDLVTVLRRTEQAARAAAQHLAGGDQAYLDFVEQTLREIAQQSGAAESPPDAAEEAAAEADGSAEPGKAAPGNRQGSLIVP